MRVATKDFAYDAPLDMRSLTDSELRIAREDENFVVSGRITIMEAGLTGDVNFDTGLLAAMTARRKLDLTEERDTLPRAAAVQRQRQHRDADPRGQQPGARRGPRSPARGRHAVRARTRPDR